MIGRQRSASLPDAAIRLEFNAVNGTPIALKKGKDLFNL
jgi:hypothetical protein